VAFAFALVEVICLMLTMQAISIMVFAWISDRYQQRASVIAVQAIGTIVGLIITGFAPSPGWRYAGA
jgi:MFS family permease